jgi:hypothetical protein
MIQQSSTLICNFSDNSKCNTQQPTAYEDKDNAENLFHALSHRGILCGFQSLFGTIQMFGAGLLFPNSTSFNGDDTI